MLQIFAQHYKDLAGEAESCQTTTDLVRITDHAVTNAHCGRHFLATQTAGAHWLACRHFVSLVEATLADTEGYTRLPWADHVFDEAEAAKRPSWLVIIATLHAWHARHDQQTGTPLTGTQAERVCESASAHKFEAACPVVGLRLGTACSHTRYFGALSLYSKRSLQRRPLH